jgi:glycine dehydrogenase subunit 2
VGVRAGLEALLPNPQVKKDADGVFYLDTDEKSAGYVSNFLGNFGVLLRAYTYILTLGRENVKMVGPLAVLNANYVKESLKNEYYLPIEGICKHEFVFDGLADKSTGVTTIDIAKRLLDYGYHAPTIYFPLLFHQSIMIEPTETESKETLDEFIAVMKKVAAEAIENPDVVKNAPHSTPVRRLDETTAARSPKTTYRQLKAES